MIENVNFIVNRKLDVNEQLFMAIFRICDFKGDIVVYMPALSALVRVLKYYPLTFESIELCTSNTCSFKQNIHFALRRQFSVQRPPQKIGVRREIGSYKRMYGLNPKRYREIVQLSLENQAISAWKVAQ